MADEECTLDGAAVGVYEVFPEDLLVDPVDRSDGPMTILFSFQHRYITFKLSTWSIRTGL